MNEKTDKLATDIAMKLDKQLQAMLDKSKDSHGPVAVLMALEFLTQKTAYSLMQAGISETDCVVIAKRGSAIFEAVKRAHGVQKPLIQLVRH